MSRRKKSVKRTILADSRYDSQTVSKFINVLMYQGKKSTAERIFYGAMDLVDMVLQVTNAALVTHAAICIQSIRNRDTVLGDHQFTLRSVIFPDAHQQGVQAFGEDFPHARVFIPFRVNLVNVDNRDSGGMFNDGARVVVHAQQVEGADLFQVAGFDKAANERPDYLEFLERGGTFQQGIEHDAVHDGVHTVGGRGVFL